MTLPKRDFADLESLLDDDFRQALQTIPLLDLSDLPKARAERLALAQAARASLVRRPDVIVEDRFIESEVAGRVRVRCYRPVAVSEAPAPALLWMHGGGHVIGTVEQDDPHLERLVSEIGCRIVSVDWPLSPEHPYPAAIECSYAALAWLFDNAAALGVDDHRIAVGGTSSGGGLAAGLCLLARDRGIYSPCFQWLFYPMLDDRNMTRSSHATQHPHVWNRQSNLLGWRHYLGAFADADEVPIYAAPARATDLSGLPPTYIGTGALDLFVDENLDYAARLLAGEVATELVVYPRAIHGFDLFLPSADISQRFIADRTAALRRALLG